MGADIIKRIEIKNSNGTRSLSDKLLRIEYCFRRKSMTLDADFIFTHAPDKRPDFRRKNDFRCITRAPKIFIFSMKSDKR